MSTPMTTAQCTAAFDKWGVKYRVHGNPDTFGRPGRWGDVKGGVIHHTGVRAANDQDFPVIYRGRPDLPPPLAQFFLGDDSYVNIVSLKRSNHAGKGAVNTYNALTSEDYSGNIQPGPDAIDFNAICYGVEIGYDGTEDMGDERYKNLLLMWAAICDFHGWTAKSVIAHYELTRRKWDPGFHGQRYNMDQIRRDIQVLLDGGHKVAPVKVSTAKTPVATAETSATFKGEISESVFEDLGAPHYSIGLYKKVLFGAQGVAYKARYGAQMIASLARKDVYDSFTRQVTKDTYTALGSKDSSWLQGNLEVPGRKLLQLLGFKVVA